MAWGSSSMTSAIERSFQHLFPTAEVEYRSQKKLAFNLKFRGKFHRSNPKPQYLSDSEALLFFTEDKSNVGYFRIARGLAFSSHERDALKFAVSTITEMAKYREGDLSARLMATLSSESLFVARLLRGKSDNFARTFAVLRALMELSYHSYEDTPCTSGIIYSSDIAKFATRLRRDKGLDYRPFAKSLVLDERFFDGVLSHRYVDGRNSFYVATNGGEVAGVVEVKDSRRYDLFDRSSYRHVDHLLSHGFGRTWCVLIGRHRRLHIRRSNKSTLIWNRNQWEFRDDQLVLDLLKSEGMADALASSLWQTLLTFSDMHMGTVLLIRPAKGTSPKSSNIDLSPVADALKAQFVRRSLSQLRSSHRILGIASSDGLTEISDKGRILDAGKILDISAEISSGPGGGRSKAAIAASHHGLAIKVSEDGPIGFWKNGEQILRLGA
jgi:hypothetical protein